MKKLIVTIAFLFLMPLQVYSSGEDDFGEGERSINEFLNITEDGENGEDAETGENSEPSADEENEEDSDEIVGAQSPNLFFLTMQLLLGLGAVLFCIYALLKFINKRARSFSSHATIQNIGGAGVGANKSVQLVKIGDRLLVLGVGDSVSLLKEINDQDEINELVEKHQSSADMFDQPVSKITGWLQKRRGTDERNSQEAAFQSLLDKEMKGVRQSQNKIHSALEEKDR